MGEKLIKLKKGELDKIECLVHKGEIKAKAPDYLSSNVDEIISVARFHKRRLEEDILKMIGCKDEFHDVNAYVLGEEKEISDPKLYPWLVIEYEVNLYCVGLDAYYKLTNNKQRSQ